MMSKRSQVHFSSVVLAGAIALLACYLILVLYVPQLADLWTDQGQPLSFFQRAVVSTGQMTQSLGIPLLGLLVWLLVAALVWRIVAQIQYSVARHRAGQGCALMTEP